MAARGKTEYLEDGCVDAATWSAQQVKILFYLKEGYGFQGCGVVERGRIYECIKARIPTIIRTVTLAAAYYESKVKGRTLADTEIDAIDRNNDVLTATLSRLAFLNIKKHSGNSRSNGKEIRAESVANAPLLKQQVEGLSPNIIVAGGDVCWDSLTMDIGLFANARRCSKPGLVQSGGVRLVRANHPSVYGRRGWIRKVLSCILESEKEGSDRVYAR